MDLLTYLLQLIHTTTQEQCNEIKYRPADSIISVQLKNQDVARWHE